MEIKAAFGKALKQVRIERGLSQEEFSDVSGRTYISVVERGLKCPTIEKLDELAGVLGVHPLTVLARCYLLLEVTLTPEELLDRVRHELGNQPR